jgi:hypothetical protein
VRRADLAPRFSAGTAILSRRTGAIADGPEPISRHQLTTRTCPSSSCSAKRGRGHRRPSGRRCFKNATRSVAAPAQQGGGGGVGLTAGRGAACPSTTLRAVPVPLDAAPLRFPVATQHEVMRCRTGIVTNAESAKVPDLRCTATRCTASGTRKLFLHNKYMHSRDAIAPEACLAPRTKNRFAPGTKEGGEAPTGALSYQSPLARRRIHRWTRPPIGASPRHSPPALTPMAQPQNRVSQRLELAGVLPAYI